MALVWKEKTQKMCKFGFLNPDPMLFKDSHPLSLLHTLLIERLWAFGDRAIAKRLYSELDWSFLWADLSGLRTTLVVYILYSSLEEMWDKILVHIWRYAKKFQTLIASLYKFADFYIAIEGSFLFPNLLLFLSIFSWFTRKMEKIG